MPVTTFAKKQYGAELILTPVSAGRHLTSHQKAFCSKYEELVVDCISGYPRSGGWETNWLLPLCRSKDGVTLRREGTRRKRRTMRKALPPSARTRVLVSRAGDGICRK